MNLDEIFTLYKNFKVNYTNNKVKTSEKDISKKVLALQITLGNLATLSNCCEFIKAKTSVTNSSILDEYLSCLNFIFSIGVDMGIDSLNINPNNVNSPICDQFLNLYVDINDFINFRTEDQFSTLLESFLSIGESLNISSSDIYEMYALK